MCRSGLSIASLKLCRIDLEISVRPTPVGTLASSAAFQRRVGDVNGRSPVGTADQSCPATEVADYWQRSLRIGWGAKTNLLAETTSKLPVIV
jgi:hypothetical protein